MIFTTEGHKSFSVDELWNLIQAGLEQINKSVPSLLHKYVKDSRRCLNSYIETNYAACTNLKGNRSEFCL
jgi:hypothetical protein